MHTSTQCQLIIEYSLIYYLLGIVGLNNIKSNDYCNIVLQGLSHISPIRNYFLLESNTCLSNTVGEADRLLVRFGELIRKLWNCRNFKAHVSPHEMPQAVVLGSSKKFQVTPQSDPLTFSRGSSILSTNRSRVTRKNRSSVKCFRMP